MRFLLTLSLLCWLGIAQAEGARLPKITVSAGVTRTNDALTAFGLKLSQRQATFNDFGAGDFLNALNSGGNPLPIAPDNLNYPGAVNNFNTRIEAQLPLYTGGRLQGYMQQARSMLMAAQAGDQVVLFGPGAEGEPTAQDWAIAADTISYEIVTRLGPRVERVYVGGSEEPS